jgi:hypothetical protein
MTRTVELSEFLRPRLRELHSVAGSARPGDGVIADLDLIERLAPAGVSEFANRVRYRLLLDIATRRGWTEDPDFQDAWNL